MSIPIKTVKIKEVFQARITPKLKWPHDKVIVNYDSQLVFPDFSLAERFVPYYYRELIEMGMLDAKQSYESGVIKLTVFDGVEKE